jgi:ATP-dependent 26S proteasome regulatory subunit
VKASSGPRYVVGCRNKVDKEKLVAGTRVALDMTTLTIMRALPREVSSLVIRFSNSAQWRWLGYAFRFGSHVGVLRFWGSWLG